MINGPVVYATGESLDCSKYSINLDSAMDALWRGFTPGSVPACFSWVYGSQCCCCAPSWVCVGLGLERGVYDGEVPSDLHARRHRTLMW